MGFGISFAIDLKDNPFCDYLVLRFLLSAMKMNSGGKNETEPMCITPEGYTRDCHLRMARLRDRIWTEEHFIFFILHRTTLEDLQINHADY